MSDEVFANGREISGKKSGNKSVAAMPDVCLSPPAPPAGPLPIPYPNTSKASDTTGGSKSVRVGGKEVGLKNQSTYKKSTGNEAATRNFGGGVVSHTITGKTKHAAWSFDVKVEGQNVVRHMDLTTHNHQNPTNGAITLDAGAMFLGKGKSSRKDCERLAADNEELRSPGAKKPGPSRQQLRERTTLTTGQYQNARSRKRYDMKAFSRKMSPGSGWAEGVGTKITRKGGKVHKVSSGHSNIEGFRYTPTSRRPYSSHTESRIIEDIVAASNGKPRGRLLMNIRWKIGDGEYSYEPCKECRKVICAAQKANKGFVIELCDDKGRRMKVDCDSPRRRLIPA